MDSYECTVSKCYMPKVIIEPIRTDIKLPWYASDGDSGMDVYATEDTIITPGETVLMKLGFKLGIPKHPLYDFGYRWEAQIRARSGVAMKTSLRVANSPGTIDQGYKNEVGVLIHNTKDVTDYEDDYVWSIKKEIVKLTNPLEPLKPRGTYLILKGDRFAQIVFNEIIRPMKLEVGKVDTDGDRGGGFGHTGV